MRVAQQNLLQVGACVAAVALLAAANPRSELRNGREVERLRAHFAEVLRELRSADISHLSASQHSARAVLISRLEEYASAGRFPHNHVVPGRFVPVFRDEHGTLCAMGYLIASTGRTDVVDDVAVSNNLALIPQLAYDTRLQTWLDSTGLTLAEAARIQPMYGPPPAQSTTTPGHVTSAAYFLASGGAMAVSAYSLMVNIAPRDVSARKVRRNAVLGIAAGASQFLLGAFALDNGDAGTTLGIANMTVGAAGLTTAFWRARHIPEPKIAARTVSIQPILGPDFGFVLSARM